MLDSIYHMTLKLLLNCVWCEKRLDFAIYMHRDYWRHYIVLPKSLNHYWFIYFSAWHYKTGDTTSYDKNV